MNPIDPFLVESLTRYVMQGCRPGGFLTAVLTNDLKEAFMRADSENAQNLQAIVNFCYLKLPAMCWGSTEKVEDWLRMPQNIREPIANEWHKRFQEGNS